MMCRRLMLSFLLCVLSGFMLCGKPFSFESSSKEIQDFVVYGMTNCIRGASLAVMHLRSDEDLHDEDGYMDRFLGSELGLEAYRCIEMLKGDPTVADYTVCYLYRPPRAGYCLPPITYYGSLGCYEDWGSLEGQVTPIVGDREWLFFPPYDPQRSDSREYVQLMFLTPEPVLDVRRLWPHGHGPLYKKVGEDPRNLTADELMRKLGIEHVFSNRVFRMNAGCVFQVDYPVPELDWRGMGSKEELDACLMNARLKEKIYMGLTPTEVSEIVCLAYAVDGDERGYVAACARCPRILKPVGRVQTVIGRRLLAALEAGGMISAKNRFARSPTGKIIVDDAGGVE